MDKSSITEQQYGTLQRMFDFFNRELFAGELPQCLITMRCNNAFAFAYYSRRQFGSMSDGKMVDEIAFNAHKFITARGEQEIAQTMVHEMVHLWQYHFGKPSRPGYHNQEFARKMMAVGLTPSDTGAPGGKMVGPGMNDYATPGGKFIEAFQKWRAAGISLEWADVEAFTEARLILESGADALQVSTTLGTVVGQLASMPAPLAEEIAVVREKKKRKNKIKYSCPECGQNAWGSASSALICGRCYADFGDIWIMEAQV